MKSHYDTLGVTKDASTDDIKTAFRKLSMETHPDVAGPNANAERFKQIAEAANILTNTRSRRTYDSKLEAAGPFGGGIHYNKRRPRNSNAHVPTEGLPAFVHNLMRPRTFVIGIAAIVGLTAASDYFFGVKPTNRDGNDLVQAWFNPATQKWEQPAPWDPSYRRQQPNLEYMPRDQVKRRQI